MSVQVITRISETKRGRLALFSDEGFLFSIDAETLAQQGIREGSSFSEEELSALKARSDTRRAKDQALRLLARRAYGQQELYARLCQKYDEHSAAAAVALMCELGMLDDEAFAAEKARALAEKGKGRLEISRKLRELGIDRDIAATAVEALAVDDVETAAALLRKNYLDALRRGKRQNVMAALARRGFGHSAIRQALALVAEEVGEDGGPEDEYSYLP